MTQTIVDAIRRRKSLRFRYDKEDEPFGERIGDPHAIFRHPKTGNLTVHVYQTSGVSSTSQDIPNWRPFLVEHVKDVSVIEVGSFEVAEGYNPNSELYTDYIEKI